MLKGVGVVRSGALLALPLLVGCAVYRPTDLATVRPGSEVRVEVGPTAVSRVRELTRATAYDVLDGSLRFTTQDSLVIESWRTDLLSSGQGLQAGRIPIPLARSEVLAVSVKTISPVRTGVLVAAVAGALYLLMDRIAGVGGGIDDGGGAQIILVPLRFP